MTKDYKDFGFGDAEPSHMHTHFMPGIFKAVGKLGPETRVLDVGCGNGFTAGQFLDRGCTVVGIDLSESGIGQARQAYPKGRFEIQAADSQILTQLNEEPFDIVVSTEVIEHLYAPRAYAAGCFSALKPGGIFVCTTPYHGYLKNLVLSVFGQWDSHADPLWDGGHIKLWSRRTLTALLKETGFRDIRFEGAGRAPFMWMTMILAGRKPVDRSSR